MIWLFLFSNNSCWKYIWNIVYNNSAFVAFCQVLKIVQCRFETWYYWTSYIMVATCWNTLCGSVKGWQDGGIEERTCKKCVIISVAQPWTGQEWGHERKLPESRRSRFVCTSASQSGGRKQCLEIEISWTSGQDESMYMGPEQAVTTVWTAQYKSTFLLDLLSDWHVQAFILMSEIAQP